MSALEVVAALLVALVWGVQFVTSKYGVDVFPQLLFVTLRFAAVGLLLLPFAGRPTRREIAAAAAISVFFGGLCFGLFFVGLHLGLAGLSESDGLTLSVLFGIACSAVGVIGGVIWIFSGLRIRSFTPAVADIEVVADSS